MNYRHDFHAGNFADVVKHVVLTRILLYLKQKPAPFRVLETHAGAGAYDLAGDEARRTGEWREGVGRLGAIDPHSSAGELLAPYLACVGPVDPDGRPQTYPGSPRIVQALLRPVDRALFCETQEPVRQRLLTALGRDRRLKVLGLDGWTALGAFLPPPERRGLVLVDPPFEAADEFTRLAESFAAARRRWPTGVFALWYPVKSYNTRDAFLRNLRDNGADDLLRIEYGTAPVRADARLTRAGLILANPPFVLAEEVRRILPALASAMGEDGGGEWDVAEV